VLPKSISGDAGEGVLSKFTGNVSYDMQDEEERFDAYVKQLKQQKERGWKVNAGWVSSPILNQESVFKLSLQDKAGEEIKGADVKINFQRASQMALDHKHSLIEGENGSYSKAITFPQPGCWQVQIHINKGDDTHEIRGDTEVDEVVDGKRIKRPCEEGAPEMDTAR
jgi:nitrogen fixation protein FixH